MADSVYICAPCDTIKDLFTNERSLISLKNLDNQAISQPPRCRLY